MKGSLGDHLPGEEGLGLLRPRQGGRGPVARDDVAAVGGR